MKTPLLLVAVGAVLSAGTLLAQGFNMRPGAWEMTMTMQGGMPMAGLPPEIRAQIEAEMKKPQVVSSCVMPEDLKQLNLGKTDDRNDEDCKVTSSRIGATSADITRECSGDESYTETAHYEVPTPQTFKANVSRKGPEGTTAITMTGKWVAAKCQN